MKAFTTFQFTPLREGRRRSTTPLQGLNYFNSRPSARGDCNMAGINTPDDIFQFTPLREGRRQSLTDFATVSGIFQFTPLREGRRHRGSVHVRDWHFNSRPSARGDGTVEASMSGIGISIHAPPRGATGSISPEMQNTFQFQFTPLREGRHAGLLAVGCAGIISIHAPPRGATCRGRSGTARRWISIHAPPRGATAWCDVLGNSSLKFQFTPLREGRPSCAISPSASIDFNSRPSARGDNAAFFAALRAYLFQFTPLREGRRFYQQRSGRGRPISIHAPPRGATNHLSGGQQHDFISIHAPPRGATRTPTAFWFGLPTFQFTPLREGRRRRSRRTACSGNISIHAPPRGATTASGVPVISGVFQFTPLREGRRRRKSAQSRS